MFYYWGGGGFPAVVFGQEITLYGVEMICYLYVVVWTEWGRDDQGLLYRPNYTGDGLHCVFQRGSERGPIR